MQGEKKVIKVSQNRKAEVTKQIEECLYFIKRKQFKKFSNIIF
jgi:hypothetical protein